MTKAAAQVQKAFVKGDTKKMEWSGVAWLANESNTVVCFKSWSDAGTVYGGLKYHHKYHGVPFTQEDLDIHYPELKQYTGLTKAKIGSAKVGFQDVRSPLAVQHRGHTYIVPPLFPTDIWMRLPKSMLNPTLTAEQQKYLDTHEMNTQILLKTEIVLYHVGIEHAIAKAKHIEKQGYRVELQKYAPIGGRPLYTVLKVLTNLKAAEPKTTAAARKTTKKTVAKPANVSKIERALSKLKPLDVKERELKVEERQLRMSQAIGQESPAYHRLLDKIIGIQAKKAKIWNTELRGMVIPETGKTMWQMAIASPTLPVNLHGQETLLHFNVPELLAAVETHKRKPAPAPNLPPALTTAPPELTAGVFGAGLTPTPKAKKPVFTVPGKPAPQTTGKQTIPTEKEFYKVEYWQDPKAGRHPASGAGRLPMRYVAYLETATVLGDIMWKMHNPVTGEDAYFDFDDKEEAIKQYKNLYKKTFGTQKAAPRRKPAPAPNLPPALTTAPPELTAGVFGAGLTPTPATKPKRKPPARTKRKQPAKLTAEEIFQLGREVANTISEVGGTVLKPTQTAIKNAAKDIGVTQAAARVAIEYYNWGHTYPDVPSVKRTTRKPAAKPKPTAVPKARKPKAKTPAAAQKLTATQREHLAIQGFVMVRRGGKYVKITG